MTRGWWELSIQMNDDDEGMSRPHWDLNDIDREHIAQCIIGGCSSGEIVHED